MNELRVWHATNLGHETYPVNTPDEAKTLINILTQKDLNNSDIEYNAFGLEEYDESAQDKDSNWFEYYNEDGKDIMEIMDKVGV